MLGCRKITATLAGEILQGSVARGCLQGGILLPLLWSLVVDELMRGISKNGCYTMGHKDNIATTTSVNFKYTISELLQEALNMVQQ
jgi:hypothetical protein